MKTNGRLSLFARCCNRHRILLLLACITILSVYNLSSFFFITQPKPLSKYPYHSTHPPNIRADLNIDSGVLGAYVQERFYDFLNESTYDVPLHSSLLEWNDTVDYYPETLMETNWSHELHLKESIFFVNLQHRCLIDRGVLIRSVSRSQIEMGSTVSDAMIFRNDSRLVSILKECPAIDVYVPESLRGDGYCEDGLAYLRGLNTRLMPRWVFEDSFYDPAVGKIITYFEMCPSTAVVFLNHYWDGFNKLPTWPKEKPIYLMFNAEMYEITPEHLWLSDVVLTKSLDAYRRTTKWFQQNGNPKGTVVFYTRHTTTDVTTLAAQASKIIEKDFNEVRIRHAPGGSHQKNTPAIAKCWMEDPSMPLLEIFVPPEMMRWREFARSPWNLLNHSNYKVYPTRLSAKDFGDVLTHSTFFLCPSAMEGYGHYINQARAAGGVVLTTNAPPMNELVTSSSGFLVSIERRKSDPKQLLGGAYEAPDGLKNSPGIGALVKWENICEAVSRLISDTTPKEREMMSLKVKRQYAFDTNFFLYKMRVLEAFAWDKLAKKLSKES
uniref:Uncharacterized protein AlNc14C140G7230 n=1 Tax=Albugo laibachii Nc14 TaxID=890382 RepID=F0WL43_9STRA|nr:conserved hypothetical protein [Albugo laibachii Nc14]|eukprot:CCA22003.1 conserved hypothetical protein [Albugo laibachii Nc14]